MESKFFTPDMRQVYVNRLTYIMANATKPNIKSGKNWYKDAYRISEDIGIKTDTPGIVVRRVLSKISPRNRWESSIPGAENLIRFGPTAKTGTTDKFAQLAYQMVLDHSLHLFNKNAPKTLHFFENMDKPEENTGVTVDRHAVYATGIPFNPNSKGPNSSMTKKQYYWIASVYEEVAQSFDMLPHQVQAIIWNEAREGRAPKWNELTHCF